MVASSSASTLPPSTAALPGAGERPVVLPHSRIDRLNVSESFEKVPAEEYARRHGWRKSAVVHRIRAGLYDGVKEGGTWYVFQNAPPRMERAEPGFDYVPPTLPWPTVPFPLGWVSAAFWIGFAAMILPLLVGRVEELFIVFGIGLMVVTAPRLYEGLTTGTIRAQYGPPMSYSRHPMGYGIHALCYLGYSVIGIAIIIHSLFG